ncbi:MAG: bile acid:sodium symporter family protein [Bacteroidetes bacterium]|nr:bile acid:sodium symporter family protein [Bacteroidota bacterium]
MSQRIVALFPLLVLIASVIALLYPPLFTWFSGPLITFGLGLIMLGMGITLRWEDFHRVSKIPGKVFLGVTLQYTVMPALGYILGYIFQLPKEYCAGLCLVASCPGGTASNVICYIAGLDVALSVTMTTLSTLLAVFMTPALTSILVGNRLYVDTFGLFWSTVQVIIIPIALGISLRRWSPSFTQRLLPSMPVLAVFMITLIVASIIGAGKTFIIDGGFSLFASVFSLHALGFFFGYVLARLFKSTNITAKTISIEVGMQNSGLGVVLARQNFASPLVAIPSAISSLFHSLIASFLAGVWRWQSTKKM